MKLQPIKDPSEINSVNYYVVTTYSGDVNEDPITLLVLGNSLYHEIKREKGGFIIFDEEENRFFLRTPRNTARKTSFVEIQEVV